MLPRSRRLRNRRAEKKKGSILTKRPHDLVGGELGEGCVHANRMLNHLRTPHEMQMRRPLC
jgi:hypothetical protein